MITLFLRILDADGKADALRTVIREPELARGNRLFEVDTADLGAVPRSPFAYWTTSRVRGLFASGQPFEAQGRAARVGVATLDNFRFIRLVWEVPRPNDHRDWCPYAKGGAYSPFYDAIALAIKWTDDGREVKRYVEQTVGSASRKVQATEFYFRPGITWPSRTQSGFAPRALPAGCIFDTKGNSAFIPGDDADDILAFLSLFLSLPFRSLVNLQMSFGSYEVGVVQRTPIPVMSAEARQELSALGRRGWFLKRSLDSCREGSLAFESPALLQVRGASIGERVSAWKALVRETEAELDVVRARIDERCLELYGIDGSDRLTITEDSPGDTDGTDSRPDGDEEEESSGAEDGGESATVLAADLMSWAVGVAFGRFDVRLAMGTRPLHAQPGPFEPLPACSPGVLKGDDGLPATSRGADYPLRLPDSDILVDDPGHLCDLTAAVRSVCDGVFGAANADGCWEDMAALLNSEQRDLREWLTSKFFEHHLRRYSKSRRKAPIVWQLGTSSSGYSVWLYAHRLTKDTFYQVQNDFVGQKLSHEERRLQTLSEASGSASTAAQRREIAAQERLVIELREMLEEVKRITPLWLSDLNDGVVLTMAPLWRLVPHHKSWQRELRTAWDALCSGKYDWAHIAMHLWPERVVPKCATDRSLAIAHALEHVFWHEGADGKWQPRPMPIRSIEAIVRERTSPAVKAALKSLLDAPVAIKGGPRGRRTAAAAANQGVR